MADSLHDEMIIRHHDERRSLRAALINLLSAVGDGPYHSGRMLRAVEDARAVLLREKDLPLRCETCGRRDQSVVYRNLYLEDMCERCFYRALDIDQGQVWSEWAKEHP